MPHQSDMNERKDMTTNQNRGEQELLPCPFCGGKPELRFWGPIGISTFSSVDSTKCGNRTDTNTEDEELAIKAWNTRADTALQLRVTSLEGALKHLIEVYDAMGAPRGPSRIMAEATLSPSGPQEA